MKKYPDISHYHPVTDWNKVKGEVGFLISKATQGTGFVDRTLESFIKGCETNKIHYWLYTYLNKGNELEQAKFLVSTCKEKVGKYFVGYSLDIEEDNKESDVQEALNYISGLKVKTMIYTIYSQYSRYKSLITGRPSSCAWWEARYGKNSGEYNKKYPCHEDVDLHQFTSNGVCPGLSGNVDLNRLPGEKGERWFLTADIHSDTDEGAGEDYIGELIIDGKMGTKTTRRAQEVFGTVQDGVISNQLSVYKSICPGILSANWESTKRGGSLLVKALQKKVGADPDGYLGPRTIRKWQKWMGTTQDGVISYPSECIKAFQKWLNKQ
ncbi:MAG: hypothetical protein HFG80_07860 [Eubacterium sp.]|jgi:Lyzozyme M1 (1,4-beta-N-acetylmuramidase)|nr:hypothetical protein [Eubacterium sp.]